MKTITTVVLCLLLAGCVMAVDESLPYAALPSITVATEVKLVASPAHPTAYLSSTSIAASEKVQVIGSDKDAAWLLVLHKDRLGWMPSIFSRDNVGTLKAALVVEPLADNCTEYLDVVVAPDEAWESNTAGAVIVVGSIYRPQTGKQFDAAALAIQIDGSGTVIDADYVHTPLTPASAIILFAYSVTNLQKGDQISFEVSTPSNEPLSFQAAFFGNDCPQDLVRLPIGKTKIPVTEPASVQRGDNPQPKPTKEPIIVSRPPPSVSVTAEANRQWNDTGIVVQKGERVQITYVSGQWREASQGNWATGTEGCNGVVSPPLPTKNILAKVNDRSPICVGKHVSFVSTQSGILYLGMNDRPGTFEDNEGSITLEIEIAATSQITNTVAKATNNQFLYTDCVNGNCDVYLWDIQDKRLRRIIDDPQHDSAAVWSPDGQTMVFASKRSGLYQLYLFDFSSDRIVKQLTQSVNIKSAPSWSPDGRRIVYEEIGETDRHIMLLDMETMETKRLTQTGMNEFPQWSPAGDKVVFGAARSDSNNDGRINYDDNYHIYIMNTDGTDTHDVTNDLDYDDRIPYWMPDGIHIVFSRFVSGQTYTEDGRGEIYMINVDTGDIEAITFTSDNEWYAIPSPDGTQFLIGRLEENKNKIYLASWDGEQLGEPEFLVEGFAPAWRPNK